MRGTVKWWFIYHEQKFWWLGSLAIVFLTYIGNQTKLSHRITYAKVRATRETDVFFVRGKNRDVCVWWLYMKDACDYHDETMTWKSCDCHNGHSGVPNHQPHDCLLKRPFRCRSKKTSLDMGKFYQYQTTTKHNKAQTVIDSWCMVMYILRTTDMNKSKHNTAYAYLMTYCISLSYWAQVMLICVKTGTSHHLNQCWLIVKWILRNKYQWHFNQNAKTSIEENTFEYGVCDMSPILLRGQFVKGICNSPSFQNSPSVFQNMVSKWLATLLPASQKQYLNILVNYHIFLLIEAEWRICVSKLSILGSDNGLSPGRRQAIIETNAGILLIWALGTHFSEILIEINTFSFKKMHLKMSGKWRPFVSASVC